MMISKISHIERDFKIEFGEGESSFQSKDFINYTTQS